MRDLGFKHAQFADRLGDTLRWKGENVATAEVEELANKIDDINLCTAYGIEIHKNDGKAGALAFTSDVKPEDFDFKGLMNIFENNLPSYAFPIFLRFVEEFEMTATYKIKKLSLKSQGFECTDKMFIRLPKSKEYVELTKQIKDNLKKGNYSF
jgi:citronellyl-CoA synthetase